MRRYAHGLNYFGNEMLTYIPSILLLHQACWYVLPGRWRIRSVPLRCAWIRWTGRGCSWDIRTTAPSKIDPVRGWKNSPIPLVTYSDSPILGKQIYHELFFSRSQAIIRSIESHNVRVKVLNRGNTKFYGKIHKHECNKITLKRKITRKQKI